jgi:hypothetical protein
MPVTGDIIGLEMDENSHLKPSGKRELVEHPLFCPFE